VGIRNTQRTARACAIAGVAAGLPRFALARGTTAAILSAWRRGVFKAERGKFYRRDATLTPPVHLDPEVLAFLTARAQTRGVSLSELVNALLKKDIELIESAE
jgi:hypothetical protein